MHIVILSMQYTFPEALRHSERLAELVKSINASLHCHRDGSVTSFAFAPSLREEVRQLLLDAGYQLLPNDEPEDMVTFAPPTPTVLVDEYVDEWPNDCIVPAAERVVCTKDAEDLHKLSCLKDKCVLLLDEPVSSSVNSILADLGFEACIPGAFGSLRAAYLIRNQFFDEWHVDWLNRILLASKSQTEHPFPSVREESIALLTDAGYQAWMEGSRLHVSKPPCGKLRYKYPSTNKTRIIPAGHMLEYDVGAWNYQDTLALLQNSHLEDRIETRIYCGMHPELEEALKRAGYYTYVRASGYIRIALDESPSSFCSSPESPRSDF